MPRDDSDSAISLFSFQDIITSLTGIMFLIVLLLMLMLLTSHTPQYNTAQQQQTQQLADEVKCLEKAIQTLLAEQQNMDNELKKLKNISPEKIASMRQELQEKLQQKKNELTTVEDLNKQVDQKIFKTLQQIELMNKEIPLLANKLTEQDAIKQKQEQLLKQKQKEFEIKKNMIKYTFEYSTSKQPMLVELDASGVHIFDPATRKYNDLRNKNNAVLSLRNFEQYLSTIDKKKFYFTVAIKPGGFKYANTVLQTLKNHDLERGFEILPEDTSSILEGITL